ncbi:hypothetical protein IAU60_004022 [Kwoniella sp. DSM 27419]
MSSDYDVSGLSGLSSCEVSDALVKLGYPCGGYVSSMNRYSGAEGSSVVGPAFTVKLVRQEGATETVDEARSPRAKEHFVDACPEGHVMVISSPYVRGAACWGGLMSTAAQTKGIKAVVIRGGCRDLSEHRALGFPVFAQYHSTLGQRTFLRPSEYNVPVSIPITPSPFHTDLISHDRIGETTVEPGDIILADIDGVVCIPRGKIAEVVRVARQGRDVDGNVRRDLAAGKGVKETMAKWRG